LTLPSVPVVLPPSARRLLVIHNPVAGARRRRRFRATLAALAAAGAAVRVLDTGARGDAERMARELVASQCDMLVAAGGDGTINEVVNGLVGRSAAGGPVPLGIIPLGTANVLAAELGLPLDPAGVAEVIARGRPRLIHPGLANGRAFSMMAGAGLDAHVVEQVDPILKRIAGKGAYAVETLRQLALGRSGSYRVTVDGRSWEVGAVILAKGHFYGGRFVCAPDVRLDDPCLHVCLFPRIGRWHALRYTAGVVLGTIHRMRDYAVVRAEHALVEGPDGEAVQGDGDVIARLPLEVRVAPRPLAVVAPPARGPGQG
jgi:YegS/Rv2252/BmrU family lipid kinase